MSHANDPHELPLRRIETLSPTLRTAALVLTVLGAIAFIAALMTDPTRAWRAYHMNWVYFVSVAQGAVLVAVAVTITKGIWSRPVRRFSLAFVAFLPIAFILLLPILLFGAPHIFPWIDEPFTNGKEAWLNLPFMGARNVIGIAIMFGASLVFAYHAVRPDMGLMRDSVPPRLRGFYDRFHGGWRGQEAEELHAFRRMRTLAPAIAVIFGLVMSLVAWDFIMSLEPDWFSTLFGPFYFMGGFLGGLMATALVAITLRHRMGLHEWILPSTLHDLGKLSFGFTVFWGYLFFSQFIVIWYGLLPLEQSYVADRFAEPYQIIAQIVGLMIFVIPFFGLLGVTPKRTPAIFATFASISLIGLWLERYLLVYPSVYGRNLVFGWQEPGIMLLFLGLLLAALGWFLTRVPMFHVWQPLSEIELLGIHTETSQETADIR